jgi:hypothetical protein
MFGAPPPTIRSVLATLHLRESIDLPFLPDAIRDFADPPARSLAGPPAEAPPPPRAATDPAAAATPRTADPELDLIAAAVDDLARAGALTEADAAALRAGNRAGDQAEAMADALEAAGACMLRAAL